jgi:hypothetical protein
MEEKFARMLKFNMFKKTSAHNKRVEGDNNCAAAQKAKDPAKKKELRRLCYSLREESSKLDTEANIEHQNIVDQKHSEETTINEVTNKAITDNTEKTTSTKKDHIINENVQKETTSTRITKETEERITNIKKVLETERIGNTMITEQTTTLDKKVTNIHKQIEEFEE